MSDYQWLRNMLGNGKPIPCPVCDTTMVYHSYGAPLRVCPKCFPGEV